MKLYSETKHTRSIIFKIEIRKTLRINMIYDLLQRRIEVNCRGHETRHRIKSVNTAIKNGGKKRTLTDMINDYKEDNNIRSATCNFELLQNKINDMKDEQGNNIESYF